VIRIVIAEDSSTARQLLVAILSSDLELCVVGEAKNGIEAVELTKQLKPDLVTMDIQMPLLDGLEATRRIMIESPTPIVIVSSLDAREVSATMHALNAGALAVLSRPRGPLDPHFEGKARQFLVTLKAMAQLKIVRRWPKPVGPVETLVSSTPMRLVAIAASTGGPAALRHLLAELPPTFAPPILVVQHIADGFAQGLADWLNTIGSLRVKVAQHGERLRPHTVYLAPDDQHLAVWDGAVRLDDDPPIAGFRPSGTHLFHAVAAEYGVGGVGIILSGMGQDGVHGLAELRDRGGTVIAQDAASSEIFGMPGAAVAAGVVDHVLALNGIAPYLIARARSS